MIDTRFLFRPVAAQLVEILERLQPDDFERPTIAGTWKVRDIVAHLTDGAWRRLSFHRDRLPPPPPPEPVTSEQALTRMINTWNAEFVAVSRRYSGRVLTAGYAEASRQLADFFESLPIDAPARFPVSWAGEDSSEGWFDIGREFTELWHHQMQIRVALALPPLQEPQFLQAVLHVAVRALPHAYRHVVAAAGQSLVLRATGPSGGEWVLRHDGGAWALHHTADAPPDASITMADEMLGRLLFHGLSSDAAAQACTIAGSRALAEPLLRARAVIV